MQSRDQSHDAYCLYLFNSSLSYSAVPRFVSASDLLRETGFSSLYAVTEETAQAIVAAGSTIQFKGVVHSPRLWMDFDSYEAGEEAGARLEAMGYDFIAYDSGGRGMHFGVARTAHPSHLLPARERQWVGQHFPEADTSIYTHLHLFRLPGTVHEKTGRKKALIHASGSKAALALPALLPRKHIDPPSGDAQQSIFRCDRVIRNSMPVSAGERHYALVRLVYALRDDARVEASTAMWWANEVNKLFDEPKTYEQLEQLIGSIYHG